MGTTGASAVHRFQAVVRFVAVFAILLLTTVAVSGCGRGSDSPEAQGAKGSASNSLLIAKPDGVEKGDLLLAQVTFEKGSDVTVTAPEGWAEVLRTDNGNDIGQAIFFKIAAGEEASFTWSFSQAVRANGGILRYANVDVNHPDGPVLGFSQETGDKNPLTAPSVDAALDSVLVGFFGILKSPSLTTPPGMVPRFLEQTAQDITIRAVDEVRIMPGATGVRSMTAAPADKWIAQLVALRPKAN